MNQYLLSVYDGAATGGPPSPEEMQAFMGHDEPLAPGARAHSPYAGKYGSAVPLTTYATSPNA